MSAHLAEAEILDYLDGTLTAAATTIASAHLDGCVDCRRRLAMVCGFDEFVQSSRPEDDATTAAMFDVSQRLLTGAPPARRGLWVPVLLAALLLVGVAVGFGSWLGKRDDGRGGLDVQVVRYAVVESTRGTGPERVHLTTTMPFQGHVAVLGRRDAAAVTQLFPEGAAAAVGPGVVRLPADELLDWEFDAAAMPRELLVVLSPVPLSRDLLAQLRSAWAATPAGIVPEFAAADGRVARVVTVPR